MNIMTEARFLESRWYEIQKESLGSFRYNFPAVPTIIGDPPNFGVAEDSPGSGYNTLLFIPGTVDILGKPNVDGGLLHELGHVVLKHNSINNSKEQEYNADKWVVEKGFGTKLITTLQLGSIPRNQWIDPNDYHGDNSSRITRILTLMSKTNQTHVHGRKK